MWTSYKPIKWYDLLVVRHFKLAQGRIPHSVLNSMQYLPRVTYVGTAGGGGRAPVYLAARPYLCAADAGYCCSYRMALVVKLRMYSISLVYGFD